MNRVHLLGRVGKDIELRELGGKPFASIRLAVEGYKGVTDWFDVACWGKVAEAAAEHLAKGRRILVEGRLQTRSWQGEDSKKHYRTEIVARTVTFLDGGRSESRSEEKAPEDFTDAELGIPPGEDFNEDAEILI